MSVVRASGNLREFIFLCYYVFNLLIEKDELISYSNIGISSSNSPKIHRLIQ